MQKTPHGWTIFDAKTPILVYEYSFGPGTANSLAVGGPDGIIVVSPPCRVAPGVFDDLTQYGKVRALVASNAFHHLGLPEWKARFPDAEIFAPAQSVARVKKQSKLSGIRPLADAGSVAGDRIALTDMPHYKTGEVLVRIASDRGIVWYVTDVIMNLRELPRQPLMRVLFRLSGSGPGLKLNNIAPLFMVRNKRALRRWLASEFRSAPPGWMIATHGDIVDFKANPDAGRALFANVPS